MKYECSVVVPVPDFDNNKEMEMTSTKNDEESMTMLVLYDTDSLYFPKPYAALLSCMLTHDYSNGFVTYPKVNQSWKVITEGFPSICNDPPGGVTIVYKSPDTYGNTPPKVCYTNDTVQDLYDVEYACSPENDVKWKCLNFYQDKCGLEWNPPECDDYDRGSDSNTIGKYRNTVDFLAA